MSRKSPPTPARIWMIVVATPVMNGTPRHSMFGRMAAGRASTTNGINPSARKTVALSGTNAIIHMPTENGPQHISAPLQNAPAIGEQLDDRKENHPGGDVEIVEQNAEQHHASGHAEDAGEK